MSHVNVTINDRQYRMACEEGQEARLLRLAESLESRIQSLRGKFGEIGDARLTVMAAITVCDELLDAGQLEVLVARFVDDMTQDEVATHLGVSRKTVGNRLRAIRIKVAELRGVALPADLDDVTEAS